MREHPIQLSVNGTDDRGHRRAAPDAGRLPARACGLTGTHLGCEHGACGACTVLLDGEAVRSCLMFAVQADGSEVTTVEGIASPDGTLSPVQAALREYHGLQCGFCTPGFVMSLTALLRDNPDPTDQEIREGLSGNFCRCTGYQGIVAAAHRAAETRVGHAAVKLHHRRRMIGRVIAVTFVTSLRTLSPESANSQERRVRLSQRARWSLAGGSLLLVARAGQSRAD